MTLNLKDKVSRIVVGIDDSERSTVALGWAARFAEKCGAHLELVHSWMWPVYNVNIEPVPGVQGSGLRYAAELVLEEALKTVKEAVPDLDVSAHLEAGRAADVLLDASADADLVVVGSRGLGKLLSLVVGSTALALAADAQCSVVIVRADDSPEGPVVVAYDGTPSSDDALQDGIGLAELLDAPLRVVYAVPGGETPDDRVLAQARNRCAELAPRIHAEFRAVEARTSVGALVRSTHEAQLYVSGPRPAGQVRGAINSTSLAVMRFAASPIWLARPAAETPGED